MEVTESEINKESRMYYKITPLLLVVLCVCAPHALDAVDFIADGEHVFFYDDGSFAAIANASQKKIGVILKKRKIQWTVKSKKGGTIADLAATIEKTVLKKKPNLVVLSFGIHDLYNVKKMTVKEHTSADLVQRLGAVVDTLEAAGIRVILVTPGLLSEDVTDDSQTNINAFSDALKAYGRENKIIICDLHTPALSWIASNPPKKKGKRQLSKKGGKWSKQGAVLLTSTLVGALGLSPQYIGRAIRWDEKVYFFGGMNRAVLRINQITKYLRTIGPSEAPEGFFGPGITGPKFIQLAISDLPKSFSKTIIPRHKPTVSYVYYFHGHCSRGIPKGLDALMDPLDAAMQTLSKSPTPVFIFTPLWLAEDGENTMEKKGPRYETCKLAAEMIQLAAAKYGLAVIDLFSICEQEYAKDKSLFFGGNNAKHKLLKSIGEDGRQLVIREIKKSLGTK